LAPNFSPFSFSFRFLLYRLLIERVSLDNLMRPRSRAVTNCVRWISALLLRLCFVTSFPPDFSVYSLVSAPFRFCNRFPFNKLVVWRVWCGGEQGPYTIYSLATCSTVAVSFRCTIALYSASKNTIFGKTKFSKSILLELQLRGPATDPIATLRILRILCGSFAARGH